MTKEELLEFKKNHVSNYGSLIKIKHQDDYARIVEFNQKFGFDDSITFSQKLYNYIFDIREYPKCEICGDKCAFISIGGWRYSNACSGKCARKTKESIEKRKKTTLEKYGVEYIGQSKDIKAKIKSVNLDRYGVDHNLKRKDIIEKIKKTNLDRYGVEYPMMSEEIKSRRATTYMNKYGVESPLQNREILNKVRTTNINRYGNVVSESSIQALVVSNENKKRERYDRIKNGDEYELITDFNEYSFLGPLTWKCKSCGCIIHTNGYGNLHVRCSCKTKDTEQRQLYDYVKCFSPNAIFNDRTALGNGYEIDVYVPSLKLGFEFDGLYWHSEIKHDNMYHLNKTRAASNKGIRLVHIFEDEWRYRKDIVKSLIRYLVDGKNIKPVYARKCIVSNVDVSTAKKFLDKYHIQGADNSGVYIGLYYGRFLVAVASFNPIEKNSGKWMLSRYTTIFSRRIVGGMGKLISYFEHEYHPNMIRTFADLRVSNGKSYDTLGFKLCETIGPKYWYTKNFLRRIHRFNLRKDVFKKNADLFYEDGLTEAELAHINGYVRIYDCGYLKYEKTY